MVTPARADVERFGLFVGNNRGQPHESELRYAQSDARRVRDVLRELGGFAPANSLLLQDEDAETVRASLISLNSRIRRRMAAPDTQVMFVFYYSGHADAHNLHLGDSRLPVKELKELVHGSAASFRIAVLDACRSGALTRAKGGKLVEAFALAQESPLPGEGLAFLTASAADEDAQESDELRGSFFTHALLSGLLGAADDNTDGRVALGEAYRYAYAATLRATSRTLAGTQHPSYRYDFRGQGDLVLTRPGLRDAQRAHLQLPPDVDALLLRDDESGPVIAEVGPRVRSRKLSLRAGRYFLRARGRDVMYEGTLEVAGGTTSVVTLDQLDTIEYAQLVRKGGGRRSFAHALELGALARTPLANARSACLGGLLGYAFDTESVGVRARLGVCTAHTDSRHLDARVMGYGLDLRLYRAWDLGRLTLELGLGPGLTWFTQDFDTRRATEDTTALVPYLAVGAGSTFALGDGVYIGIDVAAETYLLTMDDGDARGRRSVVDLSLRAGLLTGLRL